MILHRLDLKKIFISTGSGLKSLNADVQVEQEEYDEVVVIKAMFLNHDYQ